MKSDPDEAVVRIAMGNGLCSGVLVDRDLVLTAEHCLARDAWWREGALAKAIPRVDFGADGPRRSVDVRAVVAPQCEEKDGSGDLAIAILDRPVEDVAPFHVRFDEPIPEDTHLDTFGYGICGWEHHSTGRIRNFNRGMATLSAHRDTVVELVESCPGDTGGPAILPGSSEVVGVVVGAVWMASPQQSSSGEAPGHGHTVGARIALTARYRALFDFARAAADAPDVTSVAPPALCRSTSAIVVDIPTVLRARSL